MLKPKLNQDKSLYLILQLFILAAVAVFLSAIPYTAYAGDVYTVFPNGKRIDISKLIYPYTA